MRVESQVPVCIGAATARATKGRMVESFILKMVREGNWIFSSVLRWL